MRPFPLLATLCTAALCTLTAPAQAQDVSAARTMFDGGLADMEAGRFEKGCPALEASYKLDPRPGTLFTLAECEAQWGHIATAVTRYDDYISMYAGLTAQQQQRQGDRLKDAQKQRATLGPQVPQLTIALPSGAPPGTTVWRDGTDLAAAMLGVALPVDPGEHKITAQAPGGETTEIRLTIARGEKKQITVEVKSPPPAGPGKPATLPISSQGSSSDAEPVTKRSPVPALIMGGAAFVAMGVGAGLFVTSGKKRTSTLDLADTVAQGGGTCLGNAPDKRCAQIDTMARQVDTFHNAAAGAFIGAAALAVGVVTYMVWPASKAKAPSNQSAAIRATPVFSTGQGGLLVSGAF